MNPLSKYMHFKTQHGTAATAWTRAWLGPSHESRFLSPIPSQSIKKLDSSPNHQKNGLESESLLESHSTAMYMYTLDISFCPNM